MTIAKSIRNTALAVVGFATVLTGLAASEASAAGYYVNASAQTSNFPNWDVLNIRKWPASHSQKVGHVNLHQNVYVQRCIIKNGSDWCKVSSGWKSGWVNGRYIKRWGQNFAKPHPSAHDWH